MALLLHTKLGSAHLGSQELQAGLSNWFQLPAKCSIYFKIKLN